MKNTYLNKMKYILREVWIDFIDLSSYHTSPGSCCGFEPTTNDLHLRREPIRVNRIDNNLKNLR